MAQAKARKVDANLLIIKHPVGGLNEDELGERITTAATELHREIQAA